MSKAKKGKVYILTDLHFDRERETGRLLQNMYIKQYASQENAMS